MTQARSLLVPRGAAGAYHCVQRCVRRAFLCGFDRLSRRSFEHRKDWIERRLRLLGDCFAVAIHAYAVMSNHLHVVVHLDPDHAATWSDAEVAVRWVRLFPPARDDDEAKLAKQQRILEQPERLAVLRARLANLSWLMRCLAEPIARAANVEDDCKGRFWEGRFKAQALCDTRATLAAMVYVDLNPVRAGIATRLEDSAHTSILQRLKTLQADAVQQPLQPVIGLLAPCLPLSMGEYIELAQWTGKQLRPGKRGVIPADAPSVLSRTETKPGRWTVRVQAIGSGYWRVAGEVEDLIERAARMQQRWLKGMGVARRLAKAD